MTDHPLIPTEIREYLNKHGLESVLNKAMNKVLREMPHDPFSQMAVELLEQNQSPPQFTRFHARPTTLYDLKVETL